MSHQSLRMDETDGDIERERTSYPRSKCSILLRQPRQLVQFLTTTLVIQLTTPHTFIHQPPHLLYDLFRLFPMISSRDRDSASGEYVAWDRSEVGGSVGLVSFVREVVERVRGGRSAGSVEYGGFGSVPRRGCDAGCGSGGIFEKFLEFVDPQSFRELSQPNSLVSQLPTRRERSKEREDARHVSP